jgi:hypothetical protein
MSRRNNANFNGRLTNYAAGLAQEPAKDGLADFIAPRVGTGVSAGQFKRYSGKNALQVYETARALGGPATRIKFESDDPYYNCKPHALEAPIDDAERDAAGDVQGAQQALEEAKTSTLVSNAKLSREVRVQTVIDAIVPVAAVGVWSNPDNDPIKEIDDQIAAITTRTGMMPNRIAIGLAAWIVIRHHPKVIARQPGAAVVGVNLAQFAAMLANPNIEVRVGVLSKDTKKFGVAKNAVNIFGAKVLVFIGSTSPTVYDPSFMKTFATQRTSVDQVYTYREQSARSDILAVDWSEDIQTVYDECASLLAIT